ncbi:hypothetical protein ACIBSV_48920 [Embleya sp. NPDC050154]|uniref:hypothetical protein n=1 Tax=Embleya sp. NPDC050154 TaxID=3363988 RepID=UPI00378CA569
MALAGLDALVQSSVYTEPLERGRADAEEIPDALDAVPAIARPVVDCNRAHVDNGRTYLREVVFGDRAEPRHRGALEITARTEAAIADVLHNKGRAGQPDAEALARVVSAVLFLAMAAGPNATASTDGILRDVRAQIGAILPR